MNRRLRESAEQIRDEWQQHAAHGGAAPGGWMTIAGTQLAEQLPTTSIRSLTEALSADELSLIVEPRADRQLDQHLDTGRVAAECEAAGASALSIVTSSSFGGGTFADLADARAACELPIVARDVIVHPLQLAAARAGGADAVMIPVWAFVGFDLPGELCLDELVVRANRLGLEVVASVRTQEELEHALDAEPDVLNIDNRDEDDRIDVDRTLDLLAAVPVGTPVISESVARGEEVAHLHRAGVDGLLLDEGHVEHGLTAAITRFRELTLDEQR